MAVFPASGGQFQEDKMRTPATGTPRRQMTEKSERLLKPTGECGGRAARLPAQQGRACISMGCSILSFAESCKLERLRRASERGNCRIAGTEQHWGPAPCTPSPDWGELKSFPSSSPPKNFSHVLHDSPCLCDKHSCFVFNLGGVAKGRGRKKASGTLHPD